MLWLSIRQCLLQLRLSRGGLKRDLILAEVRGGVARSTATVSFASLLVGYLIDRLARVDARLGHFYEAASPWHSLAFNFTLVNLGLFIFSLFRLLYDNFIVLLESWNLGILSYDLILQALRQLHSLDCAVLHLCCHILHGLLHRVKDAVLLVELLSILFVRLLEPWVVLFVRLELRLLKDLAAKLVTLLERHRDVVRVVVRVEVHAVSALAFSVRVRRHVQIARLP